MMAPLVPADVVSVCVATGSKATPADLSAFMVSVQVAPLPLQAPDHAAT
jgi:hypothetical protein